VIDNADAELDFEEEAREEGEGLEGREGLAVGYGP
jgi:hypothetical protein